jgi:hypothetical protein
LSIFKIGVNVTDMKRTILEVNVIPHADQRYPTWADWEQDGEKTTITISEVKDWRSHRLAITHEFLEETLCRHLGITQADVDAFDIPYENRRMAGMWLAACGCKITDDPGMDKHAPYHVAHVYAAGVEYGLAYLLGVDAAAYDAAYIELDGGVAGNRK